MNNKELIKKYSTYAPRYTSYPPVPNWNNTINSELWKLEVQREISKGVDLYLHIPYCQSLCYYCGCHRMISKNPARGTEYIQLLANEWELYTKLGSPLVNSLHLGGGTPTFLLPKDLDWILERLLKKRTSNFIGSVEVDPRTCTKEHLEVLARHGVKRLSLGIQDFDEKVQTTINRHQSFDEVKLVVDNARKLGFESVNFDLIYGLPYQTQKTFERTLELSLKINPDMYAIYSYAHMPHLLKNQRLIPDDALAQESEKADIFLFARSFLESNGLVSIGLDHFAKKDNYLAKAKASGKLMRNFMGHTDSKADLLLGLGLSSISQGPNLFVQNEKELKDYQARIQRGEFPLQRGHLLNDEEKYVSELIQDLMCNKKINHLVLKKHPQYHQIIKDFAKFSQDGLMDQNTQSFEITEQGELFLRNIAASMDPFFRLKQDNTVKFSQSV